MPANPKRTRLRVPKILAAANGAPCMMAGPECSNNRETTVACHLNYGWAGKGMGQKADDVAVFFACADCHRWFDERRSGHQYRYRSDAFRACVRTWRYLIETGVLS